MADDDTLTPEMMAAVMVARGHMFEALEAEYPGEGAQLYAIACAGGVCDLLNNPSMGPALAPLIDGQIAGTRYKLTDREPN
jgi:hypothetical protein